MILRTVSLFFSLVLISLYSASVQAQTPAIDLKNPEALLTAAQAANGLNGDDLKPWHLKATYELYDDEGKPLGKGRFEEWWASMNEWKVTYSGDHFTGATYHTPDGVAHEGGLLPWPEALIADPFTKPISENLTGDFSTSKPKLRKDMKPPLSCFEVKTKKSSNNANIPAHTYCFDVETTKLRMIATQFVTVFFNQLGSFQGRNVGVETTILVNGHPSARVHVTSLGGDAKIQPADLRPPSSVRIDHRSISSVTPPVLISAKEPEPLRERNRDIKSGLVVVGIVVCKDGTVRDAHVLESPDSAMAEAAVKAVRAYKFKAAQLEGQPVDVEINIEINFHVR